MSIFFTEAKLEEAIRMKKCCEQLTQEIAITHQGLVVNETLHLLTQEEREIFNRIQLVAFEVLKSESLSSFVIYCALKKRSEKLQNWKQLGMSLMAKASEEAERDPKLTGQVKNFLDRFIFSPSLPSVVPNLG